MKKKLESTESSLIGEWLFNGDKVEGDENCKRINWLTQNFLTEVAVDGETWSILYQDQEDGRFWEMTYPKSHMHGGGPPSLNCIPVEEVEKKYKVK